MAHPAGQSLAGPSDGLGRWKTVYDRHRRWSADSTWIKVLDGLRVGADLDAGARATQQQTASGTADWWIDHLPGLVLAKLQWR